MRSLFKSNETALFTPSQLAEIIFKVATKNISIDPDNFRRGYVEISTIFSVTEGELVPSRWKIVGGNEKYDYYRNSFVVDRDVGVTAYVGDDKVVDFEEPTIDLLYKLLMSSAFTSFVYTTPGITNICIYPTGSVNEIHTGIEV